VTICNLRVAVRAFTVRAKRARKKRSESRKPDPRWPDGVLVFDTETSIDTTQRLNFGSYRYCEWSEGGTRLVCKQEGFFYADNLPKMNPEGFACLQEFVKTHNADVGPGVLRRLKLLSRTEFVDKIFWKLAYKARALVVGFNLPFDLSRLAVDCGRARGNSLGEFSLALWRWREGRQRREHRYRPRIVVQRENSKRSFIRFNRPAEIDLDDQRPAEGEPPDRNFTFRGRFLDLRTLAYALTGDAHTLESAGKAFGVRDPKTKTAEHGVITPEYIEYNRRDVLASQRLLERLREEFDRHPIDLDPCAAYSTASVAKAYFRTMGLRSPSEHFRNIPRKVIGRAMSAFYGGRAECRIRKTVVPVVHTDFTSMYPTVQSLMGLWDLLGAEKIEVVGSTREVRRLLADVTIDGCFRPESWPEWVGFAQVAPEEDILPVRAQYHGTEWNVGVNHLTSGAPLWYAIPDLVASALLTGRPPKILRAFRLVAKGRQSQLKPVRLRGELRVDPKKSNFFPSVIEARHRVRDDRHLPKEEQKRTQGFLKVFANSGSYGVFVEMNRKETRTDQPVNLAVYGLEGRFSCRTTAPEDPGGFCFPPIGAVIPAAARLMLALLERCVTDAGGSYAFADTDSMAIVASRDGRFVPCEGGEHQLPDGRSAIRALSWSQVDAIVARFEALNPYDRNAVPGSILKIEKVNSETPGGKRRDLFAYVISAKRYALFTIGADGRPVVPNTKDAYSEHGLGHLLNPIDPECEDRDWIRQAWEALVWEALGGPRFDPPWGNMPAMMKSAVTKPSLLDRFSGLNRRKTYRDRVKPFNFLLSATVNAIDRPPSIESNAGFHLIAPYSRNPSEWLRLSWTDVHSGKSYRIRTNDPSDRAGIRVQTFANVLDRFRTHPEAKSAGPDGNRSNRTTIGLLGRLHVRAVTISHIGKETNFLEQQKEGVLLTDPQSVYLGEGDLEAIRSLLDRVSISKLAAQSGVSERMLRSIRRGDRRPSAKTFRKITGALAQSLDEAGG
jgi:hypothetical protein